MCNPFSIRKIAGDAEIPIADFYTGFLNAKLYQVLRKKYSVEDHCITLQGYGLSPAALMLDVINFVLIAPFGILAREFCEAQKNKTTLDVTHLIKTTRDAVSRLFLLFGSYWLAKEKPKETKIQAELLTIGTIYFGDIVAAETARLVSFAGSYYGMSEDILQESHRGIWGSFSKEIGLRLLERVWKDWEVERKPDDK